MPVKTLRGQQVLINKETGIVHIDIKKPYGNTFSLSDKAMNYLTKGYKIAVNLPDRKQIISKESIPFRKETVKSKFPGSKDWYRYWFRIQTKSEHKQQLLFN